MSDRFIKWMICIFCAAAPSLAMAQATAPATRAATRPATRPSLMSRTDLDRRSLNAMSRGVKFLLSKQQEDGGWGGDRFNARGVGTTALVVLALLSCGESHQAPHMTKAINFLKKAYPTQGRERTYAVALRACVWSQLPEAIGQKEIRDDLRWLQAHLMGGTNGRSGMYDYGDMTRGDYSNSQYGVLGVWYATETGLEVPNAYWKRVEEGWLRGQQHDGGWGYRPTSRYSYASMTAAAAATLYITSDNIHSAEAHDLSEQVTNVPLDRAMQWLATNFATDYNAGRDEPTTQPVTRPPPDIMNEPQPVPGTWVHYMLFAYERVGEASGLTRWGEQKWFDKGADYLFRTQNYDGSWIGYLGPEVDTAYSLLFLSRGRAPLVLQKLEFPGRWNNRPRDGYGFTRFMRRATERHVNWQIVSIDADPVELRQSPILYVASDRALDLTSEQKLRLRDYIEQGGLLLCANDGKTDEFSRSVMELGKDLFPAYNFRDLPRSHMVYSANFPVGPFEIVRSLSNGVRELIVLFPIGDMSWQWHSAGGGFDARKSAYGSLANLWLYVTDRANPRFKGEDPWVELNPAIQPSAAVHVARIHHGGNWDPERAGWQRLANILRNYDQLDLQMSVISLMPGQVAPAPKVPPTMLHLTTTKLLNLMPVEKDALRQQIDANALLLLEAAGGSPEVADSFDALMKGLYPDVTIEPLPLTHPIYHGSQYGGVEIANVDYRPSPNLRSVRIPRLKAAMLKGKLLAIISYEDLSGGIVGYSHAGLIGYTPQSATEIMRNIILWRANGAIR